MILESAISSLGRNVQGYLRGTCKVLATQSADVALLRVAKYTMHSGSLTSLENYTLFAG